MAPFLQSNVMLVVGVLLIMGVMGLRLATTDALFRKDLGGSVWWLGLFLGLRAASGLLSDRVSPGMASGLRVAWMVAFTFGVLRASVSFALWALRLKMGPTPKILRDVIDFTVYVVAAVAILKSQLDIDLTAFVATSAILSVVIGLALQETLGNLFAGLSLQLERPFQVGDWVTVGEYAGEVVQVAWRATRIETANHELVTLPNNVVAKQAVKNHTHRLKPLGGEVSFGAAHSAPPNHVQAVALDVLAQVPLVLRDPAPRIFVVKYDESAIGYLIRFFVADFSQLGITRSEVYSRLWYRFAREGIDVPYPRRVIHQPAPPQLELEPRQIELITSVDLFQALPPQERATLAREMKPRRFARGERIIVEGAEGHTFYIVAQGEVSVRSGKMEAEVARLGRGQYFGEMSLLTGEPRSATVVSRDDSVLLELDRPSFARIFETQPGLARRLSALLAQRRAQLKAATVQGPNGPAEDPAPEAGRIFTRLRQIFGLRGD